MLHKRHLTNACYECKRFHIHLLLDVNIIAIVCEQHVEKIFILTVFTSNCHSEAYFENDEVIEDVFVKLAQPYYAISVR